jgi:hypothetical protein
MKINSKYYRMLLVLLDRNKPAATSPITRFLNRFMAMQPQQGALPTLRAATDPEASGGDCFGPNGFLLIAGLPETHQHGETRAQGRRRAAVVG